MTVKTLYIDDIRDPDVGDNPVVARTYDQAHKLIMEEDWDLISFDHDLGEEDEIKNGLTLMNLLEEAVYYGKIAPQVRIHSANPAGVAAMEMAKASIDKMRGE